MTALRLQRVDPLATAVHALPAHAKLVGLVAFALAVVAVPAGEWWPFAAGLVALLAVAAAARLRPVLVLRRMAIEVPFLLFAVALPFVAEGPQITWWGLSLSQPGLLAAGALLAKSTLGVLAAVILGATTSARAVLDGLARLRLPGHLVEIAGFMVTYAGLVVDQTRRMAIARASRGFRASNLRAWPALAASLGSLFIQTYERGERVHLAMLSRGYAGSLPGSGRPPRATPRQWALVLAPAAVVALVTAARLLGADR